jgi:predicted nucleic acid-binding protein
LIYVDSNVVIRFIEGDAATRAPLEARLRGQSELITSHLTRLECRCGPLRTQDQATLALYDAFFASKEITLVNVDATVIDRATEFRAALNLRTPDAIHLASAIVGGANVFLTGDLAFSRLTQIPIEII